MTDKSNKMLELTTMHRLMCLNVIRAARGNSSILYRIVKLLDVLEFTDEEEAEIGYRVLPNGMAVWDDTSADRTWILTIATKKGLRFLKRQVEVYTNWSGSESREVMKLFEVLGLEWPDPDDEDEEEE